MIKKRILIIVMAFAIVMLNYISASQIIVIPNNYNINVTKGSDYTINVSLSNPNNYTLYTIKFEGDIVKNYQDIPTLLPNLTYNVTLTISSNFTGSWQKSIKVTGFTKVNCSQIQQATREIIITSYGANPRYIEICRNDNVKFVNNYGNSMYVNIQDLNISQGVASNDSYIKQITSLGVIAYRIEPLIDAGSITSKEFESNVHDPNDDATFNLNVNSVLQETTLQTTFNTESYNASYNSVLTGYFTLKNIGTKTAENVNIQADWFTFDKNNFNLEPNSEIAINYAITPSQLTTADTNKTYSKIITIKGSNFNQNTKNISIFINYGVIASGNMTSPEWWIKRKEYCTAFPTAPDCMTEPYIVYRDKVIYDAPPVMMNISPSDIKKYLDEINKLREEWLNYNNNWKLDTNLMKDKVVDISNVANQSLATAIRNQDDFGTFKNSFYIIFGGFMFLAALGMSGFVMYHYYKYRKYKSEGTI